MYIVKGVQRHDRNYSAWVDASETSTRVMVQGYSYNDYCARGDNNNYGARGQQDHKWPGQSRVYVIYSQAILGGIPE